MKFINDFPKNYREIDIVARKAGAELLSRFDLIKIKPCTALVLGNGYADISAQLKILYPQIEIFTKSTSQSVDLVIAHFLLPWLANNQVKQYLQEWYQLLNPNGLFMFTALGPDTLKKWQTYFTLHPSFIDMHDIGDGLLKLGWEGPILDVNYYTLVYKTAQKFLFEMMETKMIAADCCEDKITTVTDLSAQYEVIFAHAWKGMAPKNAQEFKVPLSSISKR